MKDNLKNLIILVLCALVAYLYFNKEEPKALVEEVPEETVEELEMRLEGTIERGQAVAEQDFYIDTRAKAFEDTFGYVDSRSYTMLISKLQKYIDYTMAVGNRRKLPEESMGLRFYLGAIKPDSIQKTRDSINEGLSTMFMVPTSTAIKIQTGSFLSSPMAPPPPGNLNNVKIQNELGDDNPPHNLDD